MVGVSVDISSDVPLTAVVVLKVVDVAIVSGKVNVPMPVIAVPVAPVESVN